MTISSLAAPHSTTERAGRYADATPAAVAGQGGHNVTFALTCALVHGFGLSEDVALGLLLAHYNPRCLPPWTEAELRHKVRSAAGSPPGQGGGYLLRDGETAPVAPTAPVRPAFPPPDPARIADVVQDGPGALDLWKHSPARLDVDDGSNAAEIVTALFVDAENPDPLLCVGKSAREFSTRPLSVWLRTGRLAEFALFVPAPMTARTGRTKEGGESEHTLDNTGALRFAVVEFDFKEHAATGEPTRWAALIARWRAEGRAVQDACAALLWHLAGFAPLALVVHSGNRSLHGFFPVGDAPDADVEKFMRYAASLNADPTLFRNRSQFVRLPGGTRENGCRQSVFYWNPDALTAAAGANGKEAAL